MTAIPTITRNLPEAEARLRVAAILLAKAHNVPGERVYGAVEDAKYLLANAAWEYYLALIDAHTDLTGISHDEWVVKHKLYVPDTPPPQSSVADRISEFLAMVTEALMRSRMTEPGTLGATPTSAGNPGSNDTLDPAKIAEMIEFMRSGAMPNGDAPKAPEGTTPA